jgi:hypothetical protein
VAFYAFGSFALPWFFVPFASFALSRSNGLIFRNKMKHTPY